MCNQKSYTLAELESLFRWALSRSKYKCVINMHKHAPNMQVICINMQVICIYMQVICNQYAINMQSKCNIYA
jgi:hypothetical protein